MYLAYKREGILFYVLPVLLLAFFFVLLLSSNCFVSASNDGIAVTSLDHVEIDTELVTFDYTLNLADGFHSGSFSITNEYWNSLMGYNYAFFSDGTNVYLVYTDTYDTFAISTRGIGSFISTSGTAVSATIYKYSDSSHTFVSYSMWPSSLKNPNTFLYSNGLSVKYCYYPYDQTPNLSYGYVNIYSAQFDMDLPYLISYENDLFKFALNTFYPRLFLRIFF